MRYTVEKGDTLYSIARKYYGKPWLWRLIWLHGRNRSIKDPNKLRIGQTIYLPFK